MRWLPPLCQVASTCEIELEMDVSVLFLAKWLVCQLVLWWSGNAWLGNISPWPGVCLYCAGVGTRLINGKYIFPILLWKVKSETGHIQIHTRLLGSWPLVSGRWGVADWNQRKMLIHVLKSGCHTLPQPGCPQDNRSSFIEDDGSPPPVAASHYFLRVGQWRQASLPRTFGNFGQSSIEVLLHTIRCLWICNPWALCLRWGTKLFS